MLWHACTAGGTVRKRLAKAQKRVVKLVELSGQREGSL